MLIVAHNRTLLDQLCEEIDKLCGSINTLSAGNAQQRITWSFVDSKDETKSFDPTAHIILSTAGQLAQKAQKRGFEMKDVKLIVAGIAGSTQFTCFTSTKYEY